MDMGPVILEASLAYTYGIAFVVLTDMASARFFAKGVDHCRAGADAQRLPVESLTLQHLFASGLRFPDSVDATRLFMSQKSGLD